MAKYKIEINNIGNIQELLQIAYRLSDEQLVQAQNEITKLASATRLQDEIMDAKEKYAKAINNYLMVKDKAISKKIEIAKLLTELYKYNGDTNSVSTEECVSKNMTFDFSKIRDIVNDTYGDKDKTKKIELTNKK